MSGCVSCLVKFVFNLGLIMGSNDLFSLEDDDFNELFITQSSHGGGDGVDKNDESDNNCIQNVTLGILYTDFQSLCLSVIDAKR